MNIFHCCGVIFSFIRVGKIQTKGPNNSHINSGMTRQVDAPTDPHILSLNTHFLIGCQIPISALSVNYLNIISKL